MRVSASLRALLTGLIDYAGTFPPAQLDLATAARNFVRYSQEPCSWMLGKLIVPAGQLQELQGLLSEAKPHPPVALSVLLTAEPLRDAELVRKTSLPLKHASDAAISIHSVEVRPAAPALIPEIAAILPPEIPVFCEVSNLQTASAWLGEIRKVAWSAKIRTGGVTPELFPSSLAIAKFVGQCLQERVAFKATAGLHHPVRSEHPLTYEANSACGAMHGFLNLFVGASLLRAGVTADQLTAILEDTNPANFHFSDDGVRWNQLSVATALVSETRRQFAISFGSCSFAEPLQDLTNLGLL